MSAQAKVLKAKMALFLFFINEPVGMCHSAAELNGSCCASKTTATSQPCSSLVCQGTGEGTHQSEGHLLHPAGSQSADFLPDSLLTHSPSTKHWAPLESLSPTITLEVWILSPLLFAGLSDTVSLSP